MFSVENGNDCRIRTEKYLSDALKYVETDENAKEIFEFNDEDTELLGCVWSRKEENIRIQTIEEFASELSNKDNIIKYDIDEVMAQSGCYDLACHYLRIYVDAILEQMKNK